MKRFISSDKCDFYNYFLKHTDIEIRTKKGVIDNIYKAVYHKKMCNSFSISQIRQGLKEGYIGEDYVYERKAHNSTGVRLKVYYWKEDKMFQRVWWKRWIEKAIFWKRLED